MEHRSTIERHGAELMSGMELMCGMELSGVEPRSELHGARRVMNKSTMESRCRMHKAWLYKSWLYKGSMKSRSEVDEPTPSIPAIEVTMMHKSRRVRDRGHGSRQRRPRYVNRGCWPGTVATGHSGRRRNKRRGCQRAGETQNEFDTLHVCSSMFYRPDGNPCRRRAIVRTMIDHGTVDFSRMTENSVLNL